MSHGAGFAHQPGFFLKPLRALHTAFPTLRFTAYRERFVAGLLSNTRAGSDAARASASPSGSQRCSAVAILRHALGAVRAPLAIFGREALGVLHRLYLGCAST